MISIFLMVYNEEIIFQFFIDHYRARFPGCNITVYDNFSTDNTVKIALQNNCTVINYDTNGKVDDDKLRNLKNNCWKNASTDWVLVCDADELLEFNENDLNYEKSLGTTLVKSEAYNMVNMEDNYDYDSIKTGIRCSAYDKTYVFNKSQINNINYVHGAHSCSPQGNVKYSSKVYRLYHYNTIHPELTHKRHYTTRSRLSEINLKHGWGVQYTGDRSLESIQASLAGSRTAVQKVKE